MREGSTYMTDQEAEKFCRTFADGLKSGLSYVRVLSLLERQGLGQKTVERLRTALLDRGDQLGEALIRHGILDSSARNVIVVAEQEGALPETFAQLATTYRQRYTRKKRFAKSMVEPFVLVALGLIVFLNIIDIGIAQIAFGGDTVEQFIQVGVKSVLEILLFGTVCFSAVGLWLKLPVDLAVRDVAARVWMRLPVVSEPTRLFSISLFCRYLQQGIDAGMTIHEAMELAANAANHPDLLNHYERAQELIDQGYTLTQALSIMPSLSDEVLDRIELGEESGRLDERLTELADRHYERAQAAFDSHLHAFTLVFRYVIVIIVISTIFMSLLDQEMGLPDL